MSEAKMLHLKFPRLAELCDEAGGAGNSASYFRGLAEKIRQCPLAGEYYEALENELSQLTDQAWTQLRRKCVPYVCAPHRVRYWEQLFSVLNEAKGYVFLKQLGYVNIGFVAEGTHPTPDLEASGNSDYDAILEVKTLHRSDEHYRYLSGVYERTSELPAGLASKFMTTLHIAEIQLLQYRVAERLRRFAMLVVRLDDDPDVPSVFREIDHRLKELATEHRQERVNVVIHRPYDVFTLGVHEGQIAT